MNERDYSAELYEKMRAEQEQYRNYLLGQRPEEILNHTWEYTMREDMVMAMETLDLTPAQAKALLKSPHPLNDILEDFRKREIDHMDTIRDSIESRAKELLKRERVAVVPGTAFGACGEGFLRISYAYSIADLKKALEKISHFVHSI